MRVRPARCVVLLLAASPARAYAPLYADAFKRADCADVVAAVGGCPPGSWWDSVRSPDAGTSAQQLAHCCHVCPANWHTNTLSTRGATACSRCARGKYTSFSGLECRASLPAEGSPNSQISAAWPSAFGRPTEKPRPYASDAIQSWFRFWMVLFSFLLLWVLAALMWSGLEWLKQTRPLKRRKSKVDAEEIRRLMFDKPQAGGAGHVPTAGRRGDAARLMMRGGR